jgi:hypothetical protein
LWLKGKGGERANLHGADLHGANLHGADLHGADLHGADLGYADLGYADLGDADLHGANLHDADLHGADLHGADLHGADLDFSVLPLWCGGLRWNIDSRLAIQLAYHFCGMKCDDPEFIRIRNGMLDFANRFHRVDECGLLEPVPDQAESAVAMPEEEGETE